FAPAAGLRLFGRALGPTAIALGLQFVTFAVTARGLGIGAFGLYSAVTAIAAILIEVLGFGTNDVMVRGVARDPDSFARYFGLML
ncbi:oligosaccharide flippase family protein, partial [Streptomyces galilaeus]|uniref:oligosaccharide flippase family protein n=1 Tax=Streptomyces galilaeus TaxID=33899 RepID=UPI0038F73E51